MTQTDLNETLQGLVRRHGISSVLHSLADIQAAPDQRSSSAPKRRQIAGGKPSAVSYVRKMALPPGKSDVMMRAAQCFEAGEFLPRVADIREFCSIHNIKLAKTVSRLNSIPRVFAFLAAMDASRITKLLDEGAFAGPTRLAPIADAIRNRAAVPDLGHRTGMMQAESATATENIKKASLSH